MSRGRQRKSSDVLQADRSRKSDLLAVSQETEQIRANKFEVDAGDHE